MHRDVKPANVLMRDGHAYLTDFGLTKRTTSATSLTATGQFVGTAYGSRSSARRSTGAPTSTLDPKTGARIGDPIPAGREPVAIVTDQYSAWVADATGKVVRLQL